MTSPATNPGTVASGAVPAGAPDGPVNLTALRDTTTNTYAGAVVLDVIRDDRAGVTLPTAIQPVGGDQLEPGRVGQVEGAASADVVEQERSRP